MFLVYQESTGPTCGPLDDSAANIISETIKLHQNSTVNLVTYFVDATNPIPINGVDNIPVINLSERSQRCLDSANAIKSTVDSANFPKDVRLRFSSLVVNFVRSTKILNARLVNLLNTEVLDPEIEQEIKGINSEMEKLNDDMVFFNKILSSEALRQNEYRDLAKDIVHDKTIGEALVEVKQVAKFAVKFHPFCISDSVNDFKKHIDKLANNCEKRIFDNDTENFLRKQVETFTLNVPSLERTIALSKLPATEVDAKKARLISYFRTQTVKVIALRDLVNRLPREGSFVW